MPPKNRASLFCSILLYAKKRKTALYFFKKFYGSGRTRTFDVSFVTDLQSAAFAAALLTHMVEPAGFGPATPWASTKCSTI